MLIKHNKLLPQRRKNSPEIKASVLFIILGTIADNLWLVRAVIEFILRKKKRKKKRKKTKVLSFHLKLKKANISWEQVVTIRQR